MASQRTTITHTPALLSIVRPLQPGMYNLISLTHVFHHAWHRLPSIPISIVFGEYYHAADGDHSRVARFDLDPTTKLLKVNTDNVATASKVFLHGNYRVQGAITVNGRYFLSQSNGDDDSDIIGFTPGGGNAREYDVLPPGSEDLTYDKGTDTLWTLTEKTGGRYIIGTTINEISSWRNGNCTCGSGKGRKNIIMSRVRYIILLWLYFACSIIPYK